MNGIENVILYLVKYIFLFSKTNLLRYAYFVFVCTLFLLVFHSYGGNILTAMDTCTKRTWLKYLWYRKLTVQFFVVESQTVVYSFFSNGTCQLNRGSSLTFWLVATTDWQNVYSARCFIRPAESACFK